MKLFQYLKILVVISALLAPGLIFVISGPAASFEQKKQANFPTPVSVLLPAPKSREQLADAIFERSKAKRWSIQLVNKFQLNVLGFVDTPKVISGSGQWLFFKPPFEAWECSNHQNLQERLERFSFLMDLITASEIPLVFALAPNKASIESENLGGRAHRYQDCYLKFEQYFTDAVSGISGLHFVDHSKVLRHAPGGPHTYLEYDTHWKRESGLKALNQLFESRAGILGIPLYRTTSKQEPAPMDILNTMLLLNRNETVSVPVSRKPSAKELRSARLAPNVLFIHDSFYNRIRNYIVDRSPHARLHNYREGMGEAIRPKLGMADVVVVETVQRDLLSRVWGDTYFGWGGTFAEWLLDEMGQASEQCDWEHEKSLWTDRPEKRIEFANVAATGKKTRMKGTGKTHLQFRVPPKLPTGRVCLRVELEVFEPGKLNLFFSAPGATKRQPGFSDALMVSKNLKKGRNKLALVLPETFRNRRIRLEPIEHAGEFTVHAVDFASFNSNLASTTLTDLPNHPAD